MAEPRITLKTLAAATAQAVYDQVARHLLTQKERSMNEDTNSCRYRGDGGAMCAAGCLMSDDEYTPAMEGQNWAPFPDNENSMLNAFPGLVPNVHVDLISELQQTHDAKSPTMWRFWLGQVAEQFDLSKAVIDEFPVDTIET